MFRRNRNRYKRMLVAGLGVAALVVPSSALAGGVAARYGAPDGWTPYVVSLTKASTVSKYGAPDGWTPYVVSLTKASTVSNYGAPDGWTPYVESLTRQSQSPILDGRSVDTKDAAQAYQLQSMNQIDGRSQDIKTTEQGIQLSRSLTPVDGRSPDTKDAAVLAHSPVVTITQTPSFQWGDFGIGTAAALGAVALLFFSLRRLSGRQGRKPVATA